MFANPASLAGSAAVPQPVELRESYRDLYGNLFPKGTYLLNATSGWVLLRA